MIKKITAVLTAIMITATAAFAAAPRDIAGSTQKTAIEALYGMNLVFGDENGNFMPDREVSRIEFLAMVIRMMGLEEVAKNTQNVSIPFTDVPEGHWGRGYAYYAYTLGIAQGISETELGPDRMVTYAQAVKMVVSALGYAPFAELAGGYPGGYIVKASELDLLEGIKGDDRALKREETARLILNALTVPTKTRVGEEVSDGPDALTTLGFKKYTGTLTGTFDAQSSNRLSTDNVEISGKVYDTTYFVSAELLGAGIVFYTKEVNGEEVVCYLYERSRADKIEVAAENIDPATTLSQFVYDEDDKVKSVSLDASLKVIYNGKAVGSGLMRDEILKPENGKVILRDGNRDGEYEIAIVTEYKTLVVNAVTSEKIYDKYGNNLDIKLKEGQLTVYDEGAIASVEAITPGDVLTVEKSADSEKLIIYITRDSVTGVIKEKETNGTSENYLISIDGKNTEYSLAAEYRAAIEHGNSSAVKLSIGDTGIFYLNNEGKIAFTNLTSSSEDTEYGYLLGAQLKNGISGGAEIRMLTLNNKFTTFETPESKEIYFGRMEGNKYVRTREEVSVPVAYLNGSVKFSQQLACYRLDEDGKICELQLADTTPGGNSQHLSRALSPQSMNYTQRLLNQKYIVDENTAVFYIPNSGAYEDIMAAGKYNKFFTTGKVNVTIYDVVDSHVGAVVYLPLSIERYESESDGYETIVDMVNSPVMYIQSAATVMGANGDSYLEITGIEDGETVKVKVADKLSGISDDRSMLKPGVAIQYEMNDISRGRAVGSDEEELLIVFKTVYDFTSSYNKLNTQTYNYTTSYQVRPKISVMYTEIAAVSDSFVTTTLSDKVAPFTGGTVYMKYNKAGSDEKFEIINQRDISIGQKVMIRQRYLGTRELVVIED